MKSGHESSQNHASQRNVLNSVAGVAAATALAFTMSSCGVKNPFDKSGEVIETGKQVRGLARQFAGDALDSYAKAGPRSHWVKDTILPSQGVGVMSLTSTRREFDASSKPLADHTVTVYFGKKSAPQPSDVVKIEFIDSIDGTKDGKWNPVPQEAISLDEINGGWTMVMPGDRHNWGEMPDNYVRNVKAMYAKATSPINPVK